MYALQDREKILNQIKKDLKSDIISFFDKSAHRVYIEVKPASITKVAKYLWGDLEARFNIASGVDARFHMEILYHFTVEKIQTMVNVRVKLDKNKLEVDSITPIIKGAEWIEREIHELLGINFKNHPRLERLLLSDDWPEGVHPLRRDYKEWDKKAIRDRGV